MPATLLRDGSMRRVAESVLADVLTKYGSAACGTPQMLESFLRKYGRACPQEIDVLAAALRCGVVTTLRSDKGADRSSLARLLMLEGRVSQPVAEWAVGAWSAAIAAAPAHAATPVGLDSSATYSVGRAALVLLAAAATGAVGYLAFSH